MDSTTSAASQSLFFVFLSKHDDPKSARICEDTDAQWEAILSDPLVVPETEKEGSPCLCGAEFAPGKPRRLQYVVGCHALVLDVDEWGTPGDPEYVTPFTEADLRERLSGIRAICYSSFSSSPERPKWRVVLPLKTPCPPKKYVALFRLVVKEILSGTVNDKLRDATRLGFVSRVKAATAYRWFITPGERFDWEGLDLSDDESNLVLRPITAPAPEWAPPDVAMEAARQHFANTGTGVSSGKRHQTLFTAGCRLWWDWAADRGTVTGVLQEINARFTEPAEDAYVANEVERSWDRVLGPHRVGQDSDYGSARMPGARVSRYDVADLAKRLAKRPEMAARALGRALKAIAEGERFSDPVDQADLALRSAEEIAREYSQELPERILQVIMPALEVQRAAGKAAPAYAAVPGDAALLTAIQAAQAAVHAKREADAERHEDQVRSDIQRATGGARSEPYTADEYRAWTQAGFDDSQWILSQGGQNFFFWVNGAYIGPVSMSDAKIFAHVSLSPAAGRVKLSISGKDGVRRRTLEDLAGEYGSMVKEVTRSMKITASRFDPATMALTIPTTSMRNLEPAFNAQVDAWLRIFAGAKYVHVQEWIRRLTHHKQESAVLVLVARPASGKNLLASGLARLWNCAGPTRLADVVSGEQIERCPLLFCDEALPRPWRMGFATRVREFCSESAREVNGKWKAPYTLDGFKRLIIAGNDVDVVALTNETALRGGAIQAVRERILLVEHQENAAREYLEGVGKDVIETWVSEDVIAKHALWIRDNVGQTGELRFGAEDTSGDFEQQILAGSSAHSAILGWIYRAVVLGQVMGGTVRAHAGDLFFNVDQMLQYWQTNDAVRKEKLDKEILTASPALGDRFYVYDGSVRMRMRKLNMEIMLKWVESSGADVEEFADAIVKLEGSKPVKVGAAG